MFFYAKSRKLLLIIVIASILVAISGCFSTPKIKVDNICNLLDERVSWYKATKAAEKRYGVPIYVQLAIMYQESHFKSNARPPRDKLFGVVPWFRDSSAYGFAQAQDSTWDWYTEKTGNNSASRSNFADATDFIAWYVVQSGKLSNIRKSDVYNQYLAYHEGHGGFNSGSYRSKKWLINVAKKVSANASKYKRQISECRSSLDKNSSWSLF